MAEVDIRDTREGGLLIIFGNILSITGKEVGKMLLRLDSGYAIEMSNSPIAQVLTALKLNDEELERPSEEITLVGDEVLVATDVRIKKEIAVGNIVNCHIKAYRGSSQGVYLIVLKLDTGYSVGLELNQMWLDKIFGGEDEH